MTTSNPSSDTWIYDHLHKVYFHPLTNTYAVPDPTTGQWNYVPASQIHNASTSTTDTQQYIGSSDAANNPLEDKEEGEIEDDMGWGGLMEPEKLAQIEKDGKSKSNSTKSHDANANGNAKQAYAYTPSSGILGQEKHPAYVVPYDDPTLYAYPSISGDEEEGVEKPTKERPNDTLRLVVLKSNCLEIGQVAILDTREDGIQLGRDRCEKGGQARVRLKEMEVSKTHAVIYWGTAAGTGGEGDAEAETGAEVDSEGWWIVDLGSTHGSFVTPPAVEGSSKRPTAKRLSEAKHSSRPSHLSHLSRLQIGTTTFAVHIHPSWPCESCQVNGSNEIPLDDGQPKTIISGRVEDTGSDNEAPQVYAMDSAQKKQNRELKRKREMASLREYLLNKDRPINGRQAHMNTNTNEIEEGTKREYLDRSAMRRKLHPPSPRPKLPENKFKYDDDNNVNSGANTPERSTTPINPVITQQQQRQPSKGSTFANSIMEKQGWTPGMGLGKSSQGMTEGIRAEMRNDKKGLGAQGSKAVIDEGEGDWRMRGRQRRWEEMQSNAR
ncbi:uncharacterized protein I303_108387 [Kwoniella dejecticola CBS 10117]|uniref:G-patch domain-containing protein n=1 Tax=Kwoniella dejecticola CBS 10117 TaxID=1296121 RepID=A0A1A5ZXJ1_9TREE|nr:uncharacterized protein I303_07286 [Kwoniella dejecticola CBS 10117]OBR82526.1 hypothetical protein I303_07286 [Kwoniella dejecticola CBS 10117]